MRMKQLMGIGVLVLGSSAAMAGFAIATPPTVTVNPDGSGAALGSMSAARFSKDAVQYIGCGVRRAVQRSVGAAPSSSASARPATPRGSSGSAARRTQR